MGQEVKVSGFVFRNAAYGDTYFLVTRFVVSCCVADANVLGLLVSVPAEVASALPQLNDDQWVEVNGTFAANTVDGWHMPIVVAQRITPIAVPNQPYLYP